ncbi:7-cyano-7-deazaguanine synthase [uncultured archaeon]|nr:7-cyano-7-deazaguanine synthase [uncultured archaeon]
MGIVALVSGGIDSAVMCKIIEKQGEKIFPLFVDYGQIAAKKEWSACQQLFTKCKFPPPIKVDLSGYGKLIPSGLTDINKDIFENAFLPGRNMLFLLVGTAYACSIGEKTIAIGLLSEKTHLFPDQTQEFITNTNFALNSALGYDTIIITPLINFSKSDTIKLACHYNIPLDKTYSCHSGNDKYCGKCISCREIINSGDKRFLPQFEKGD